MSRLFICTPTYDGTVQTAFVNSLMFLLFELQKRGITFSFRFQDGITNIHLARNVLANVFYNDEQFTHILFIDSDMSFRQGDIFHILDQDKDAIGVACPYRKIDWTKVLSSAEQAADARELQYLSAKYNTRFIGKQIGPEDWQRMHGDGSYCLEVESVGTGIFLVHRRALEKIVAASQVEEIRADEMFESVVGRETYYNFFDHYHDRESNRILGEDTSFCRRLREAGVPVWAYLNATIGHTGYVETRGHFLANAKLARK